MMSIRAHFRRFSSSRGETLAETLAAILVVTFAIIILMTSVVSAAQINKQASDRDAELLSEQDSAESRTNSLSGGSVTWNGTSLGSTYVFSGGADMVSYESK